jgi:uncharacterized protein YjbJ (UPF0337 family)
MAGEMDKLKGKVKDAVGKATDDDQLQGEGKADKAAGTMKDKTDKAADWAKDKLS